MILDSGARRKFQSGAVRDIADGKGRCDLLPLGIIGAALGIKPLIFIESYIRNGNTEDLWNAIKSFTGDDIVNICSALLEVSKQYEEGARKYSDRNWEKGIPVHCFIDSGVRHLLKYLRGDKDEPHDRAFIWNMLGAIWTHIHHPELIDLPFAESEEIPFACTQEEIEAHRGEDI